MSIGFGVVGTGMMGRIYVRALRQMVDGADVVAVQGGSRARELAAEVDVPVRAHARRAARAAGRRRDPPREPTQTHLQQTLAAAAAGKHVFTEKPIAATLPEIDQMVAATRAAGVLLGVNTVTRYRTGYRMAKQLIDEGAIGELRMVRHIYGHTGWGFPRRALDQPARGREPVHRSGARTASTPSAGSWATRSTPCTPAITTTRRTPRPTRAR